MHIGLGKNVILPVPNPTGNPYHKTFQSAKINDQKELQGLQVKAELTKLGNPPRSYSELLMLAETNVEMVDRQAPSRPLLGERFAKIEKARPSVQHVAVTLSN